MPSRRGGPLPCIGAGVPRLLSESTGLASEAAHLRAAGPSTPNPGTETPHRLLGRTSPRLFSRYRRTTLLERFASDVRCPGLPWLPDDCHMTGLMVGSRRPCGPFGGHDVAGLRVSAPVIRLRQPVHDIPGSATLAPTRSGDASRQVSPDSGVLGGPTPIQPPLQSPLRVSRTSASPRAARPGRHSRRARRTAQRGGHFLRSASPRCAHGPCPSKQQ